MEERRDKCLTFRIVVAVIGALSGVSIFVSFAAVKNVNAAIWGLLSAVFAITDLRMHVAHRKNILLNVFPLQTLRLTKQFGAFGSFAAVVAAVVYFTLVIVLKQGYKMENDGYMPAGIFSLITLKWTAMLYCNSKRYENLYAEDSEITPIAKSESIENAKSIDIP